MSDLEDLKFSNAQTELMAACRHYVSEINLRLKKMEKQVELLTAIDKSILETKKERLTPSEMAELVKLIKE